MLSIEFLYLTKFNFCIAGMFSQVLLQTIITLTQLAFSLDENVEVLKSLRIMLMNFLIDFQIPHRTLDRSLLIKNK